MKLEKIISIILAFAILLSVSILTVSCSKEEPTEEPKDEVKNKATIYVTAGVSEDGADGSKEHPYATLEAARDAVRLIERTDDLDGIDVIVTGTFRLSTAMVMDDPMDSGSEKCPVSWIGSDEGARIMGGVSINVSDMVTVTSSDPLYERFDSEVRDNIVVFDMKTLGLTDYDVEHGEKSPYPTYANAVIYAGNQRMTLARYPDDSYVFIDGFEPDENNDYIFAYDSAHNERIKNWKSLDDIYVNGYFTFFWAQDRTKLVSVDTENSVLTVQNDDGYVPEEGMVFYFFNVPEELTQKGEYYISSDAVLYAILPDDAETLTYPTIRTGFLNIKADYLTLDNLTFSDSRESMAVINGNHITISNCLFERGGYNALSINGDYNTFENNEIAHTTYGGIQMTGGDADTLTESHCLIYNNYFHDFSEGLATYCSAVVIRGCAITVSHNEFAHSNHNALQWQGHYNVVEYNEFYDICNCTDDAGVCYSGRTFDWYGNIFRYNYLHEIGSATLMEQFGGGCGGHGIYYDDGLGGQIAYGNIFENFWFGDAFAIGGGPDHLVEGNLFINCSTSVGYDDRMLANFQATGEQYPNLWGSIYDKYLNSEVLSAAFPTILQMNGSGDIDDSWFFVQPSRSVIKDNVSFCTDSMYNKQYSLADSVYRFCTFENNKINRYAQSKQPTVWQALEESWLDIPLEEIGRNK